MSLEMLGFGESSFASTALLEGHKKRVWGRLAVGGYSVLLKFERGDPADLLRVAAGG